MLHEPPDNTRNLLTTRVHLAWSDYSKGSELDSAPPCPLDTKGCSHRMERGAQVHTYTRKYTTTHALAYADK